MLAASRRRHRPRPGSTRCTRATRPGASGTTGRGSSWRRSAASRPTRTARATTTSASTGTPAAAPPTARRRRCSSSRPSGTTIADFRLTKRIIFRNPTQDGTHRYHVITALGGTAIEGAGNYADGHARQAQRPGPLVRLSGGQRRHGDRDRLARQLPGARRLPGRRPQPDACGSAAPSAARPAARRARPTSPTTSAARRSTSTTRPRPKDLTVDASGLLRGGQVAGSDPVRVKVTDPSGIRRVEIVDVTGAPAVVGAEDYDTDAGGVQTDRGAELQLPLRRAVPAALLRRDAARHLAAGRPPQADRAGHRRRRQRRRARPLRGGGRQPVRPRRAQRRQRDRERHDLRPLHPRQAAARGARSATSPRPTSPASCSTTPASRSPTPASPCSRATSTTTTRSCARYVTTDGDGRFSYRATAYASRLYQFAWTSHVNDVRFAANGYVTLLRPRDRVADAEPAQRARRPAGPALRAAGRQAPAPQRRHRRAGPRGHARAASAPSPTARSAATGASASPTASATRPRAGARSSSGSRSSATAASPTGAATRASPR